MKIFLASLFFAVVVGAVCATPSVQNTWADSTSLNAGQSTTIHVAGASDDGQLRYVNLDEVQVNGSNVNDRYWGAGNNFTETSPVTNGWNDLGSNYGSYQRDIVMTFPNPGTYTFAGAVRQEDGNFVTWGSPGGQTVPTVTITVTGAPSGPPSVQNTWADMTTLTAGQSTTIHITGTSPSGRLRYINLDEVQVNGSNVGNCYWGSGNSFTETNPLANGWNDIGSNTGASQRDVTMTFPRAGTFTFAGAVMDDDANFITWGSPAGQTVPTVTITVNDAPDTSSPTAPTGLNATLVASQSFTLNWTASSDNVGVTAYQIEIGGQVYGQSTSTSSTISGLLTNNTYSAKVRARDSASNWSDWSDTISVTTTTAPVGASSDAFWLDVNNDGISDEITGSNWQLTYTVTSWSTGSLWSSYEFNSFWNPWSGSFADNDGFVRHWFPDFTNMWNAYWYQNGSTEVTTADLNFWVTLEPGYDYRVCSDNWDTDTIFPWHMGDVGFGIINIPFPATINLTLPNFNVDGLFGTKYFLVRMGKPAGGVQITLPDGLSMNLVSNGMLTLPGGIGKISVTGSGVQSLKLPDGTTITVSVVNGQVTATITAANGSVTTTTSVVDIGSIRVSLDPAGAVILFPNGTSAVISQTGSASIMLPGGTRIGVNSSGKISVDLPPGSPPIIAKAVDILGRVLSNQGGVVFSVKDLVGNVSTIPGVDLLDLGVTANGSLEVGVRLGDGPTIWFGLTKLEIQEVYERDQKWNKAPNPKIAPLDYSNAMGANTADLRNYLFVAVEPSSGRGELNIKTSIKGGIYLATPLLCGVREFNINSGHDGTLLQDFAPIDQNGEAHLDFSPTGSVHDKTYKVVIGVDVDGNGQLSSAEVISAPSVTGRPFFIKLVSSADYSAALNTLDWYDNAFYYPTAQSLLRYFDGNSSGISEASLVLPNIYSVTALPRDHTHIAGSAYNPSDGVTAIDKFHFPYTSSVAGKIAGTFNRTQAGGLYSTIYNIWNSNKPTLAAPFIADAGLQERTFDALSVASGTTISFYFIDEPDLSGSHGESTIQGTATFTLQRRSANEVVLKSVTIDMLVKDEYDFDWTRDSGSKSRKAATVEIGWQGATRPGGRVFFWETEVKKTYFSNDSEIGLFNSNNVILLSNPASGPSLPAGLSSQPASE